MTSNTLAWCRWLVVLACLNLSVARGDDLSLCTARADGNYYAAGEVIRSRISADRLRLELVETAGSVDNLKRLARDECDAAIVQIDAYLEYQEANRAKRLELTHPNYLYEEFVHLVCRRDAGITGIEDLSKADGKKTVLIGEADSGSAATWRYFTVIDSSYASIPTRAVGGLQALAEIQGSDSAACMFFVAGLRSAFSAAVNDAGDKLEIVPVDDPDLDKAHFAGERIYRFREIPTGTYPRLEPDDKRDIETLTVGATLFVTRSWAAAHNHANAYLVDAIQRAKPAILQRVAPR
jgi:uncharacterized protein